MTKPRLFARGLLLTLAWASSAQAQVTIDVAKISCKQFTSFKVANPDQIALWISGYYNGKRGNTVIDVEKLRSNALNVKNYCYNHPDILVMEAVETVLGVSP